MNGNADGEDLNKEDDGIYALSLGKNPVPLHPRSVPIRRTRIRSAARFSFGISQLVFAVIVALGLLVPFATAEGWRMEGGDAGRTGQADAAGIRTNGGSEWAPVVKWRVADVAAPTAPIVAGDLVLVGSTDGHGYAFQRGNGALAWQQDLEEAVWATPAANQESAFFLTDAGVLWALRLNDGDLRWKLEVPDDRGSHAGATGLGFRANKPLLYHAGVVVFPVFSSNGTTLIAVNALTGGLLWQVSYQDGVEFTRSSVAVSGNRVATFRDDGDVVFLDLHNGSIELVVPTLSEGRRTDSRGGLVWDGDEVVVVCDYSRLCSVNASTGTVSWARELSPTVVTPAIADTVIVAAADFDLYFLDPRTGRSLWEHDGTEGVIGQFWDQPSIAGDVVVLPALTGSIRALNLRNGEIVWDFFDPSPVKCFVPRFGSPVAISSGIAYAAAEAELDTFGKPDCSEQFPGDDGHHERQRGLLYALDLRQLREVPIGPNIPAPRALVSLLLVAATVITNAFGPRGRRR